MEFAKEKLAVIRNEISPLFVEHWKEVAHYQDIPLAPIFEEYFKYEKLGAFVLFTVRDDGKLIGYAAYGIRYNIHYASSKEARQDVIYIQKEKRGFGKNFIMWCDDQLRNMGVQVVYHHIKKEHNWGAMLERMGYELVDLIYSKRLDK